MVAKLVRPLKNGNRIALDVLQSVTVRGMLRGLAAIAHENQRAGTHGPSFATVRNSLVTWQWRSVVLNLANKLFDIVTAQPTRHVVPTPRAIVTRNGVCKFHRASFRLCVCT